MAVGNKPNVVTGTTSNWYGSVNGQDHANSRQSLTFYYDRAGIEAATASPCFSQFCDHRTMPVKRGREYRVKVWQHIYDRSLYDDLNNIGNNKPFSDSFAKYGYLSSRDLATVVENIYGPDNWTNGLPDTPTNNGAGLLEGEGPTNKVSIKGVTVSTHLEKFGQMLDYTEEVDMFSEDSMQTKYRQELGYAAGQLFEDLIQIDMLSTPNVMFAGSATSLNTLGDGIGEGTPDPVTGRNAIEESFKINYELIQKAVTKLYRNRAPKHTQLTKGSTRIGTAPINASYVAIVGPEVKLDIENMIRGNTYEKHFVFQPVYMYADQTTIMKDEFGRVNDLRFIVSEQMMVERGKGASVNTNYAGHLSYSGTLGNDAKFDVFPILIPCKGAFATIGLQGHDKIVFNSIPPTSIDRTDPFGSTGLFSYKMWYAGLIVRPEKLLRINVLATA